jgi:hypothetical protein
VAANIRGGVLKKYIAITNMYLLFSVFAPWCVMRMGLVVGKSFAAISKKKPSKPDQ